MGIEDRSYYRDSYEQRMSFGFGGGAGRSVIMTIIVINLVIWVADCFTNHVGPPNPATGEKASRFLSHVMAVDTEIAQKPWNAWKFLTYGFAHASLGTKSGIWHILFNMLTLFFLGRAVEEKLGKQEFTKFYLIAVVVAGVGWFLAQMIKIRMGGGGPASAVGASGAVAAVVGLFIFNFPKQKVYVWGVLGMPAWVLGIILIGGDIITSLNDSSRIAVEAHFSGFAFAAAYHYFKWNFRWIKTEWIQDRLSGKPNLKVHHPDASFEKLKLEADEILQKIHEQGEDSLTRKERKTLEKYSRQVRKQQNS